MKDYKRMTQRLFVTSTYCRRYCRRHRRLDRATPSVVALVLWLAALSLPWLAGCDMGTYEKRYSDELQKQQQIQSATESN